MLTSIWNSVEVDAWSRDFKYLEYIDLHQKTLQKGAPLSYKAYNALRLVLHASMLETWELDRAEHAADNRG